MPFARVWSQHRHPRIWREIQHGNADIDNLRAQRLQLCDGLLRCSSHLAADLLVEEVTAVDSEAETLNAGADSGREIRHWLIEGGRVAWVVARDGIQHQSAVFCSSGQRPNGVE